MSARMQITDLLAGKPSAGRPPAPKKKPKPPNRQRALTEDQVKELRRLKPYSVQTKTWLKQPEPLTWNQLKARFGVSQGTIHRICTYQRWTHVD